MTAAAATDTAAAAAAAAAVPDQSEDAVTANTPAGSIEGESSDPAQIQQSAEASSGECFVACACALLHVPQLENDFLPPAPNVRVSVRMCTKALGHTVRLLLQLPPRPHSNWQLHGQGLLMLDRWT